MTKRSVWINSFGTVADHCNVQFDALVRGFKKLLAPIAKEISYKELYHVVLIAGATAIGELVREHVNEKKKFKVKKPWPKWGTK